MFRSLFHIWEGTETENYIFGNSSDANVI